MTTQTGTIAFLKLDKGYGFIAPAGSAERVFFHCNELEPELNFDESLLERRVHYRLTSTERGPKAVAIASAD